MVWWSRKWQNGKMGIVNFMLDNKVVDPNLQDNDGWTALIWASNKGNERVVEILLTAGADPNLQMEDGRTASMLTNKEEIKELLRQYGAER